MPNLCIILKKKGKKMGKKKLKNGKTKLKKWGKKKKSSNKNAKGFFEDYIDPINIRFTHSKIKPVYSCGRAISETINAILTK